MLRPLCISVAVLSGVGAASNGLFMLLFPSRWYSTVPGVTSTGPFNQHFVRDIGLIFLLVGASFVAGAINSRHRIVLWTAGTLWLCGHALFHLWEVACGMSPISSLGRDFPAVTLPAVIALGLTLWASNVDRSADPE